MSPSTWITLLSIFLSILWDYSPLFTSIYIYIYIYIFIHRVFRWISSLQCVEIRRALQAVIKTPNFTQDMVFNCSALFLSLSLSLSIYIYIYESVMGPLPSHSWTFSNSILIESQVLSKMLDALPIFDWQVSLAYDKTFFCILLVQYIFKLILYSELSFRGPNLGPYQKSMAIKLQYTSLTIRLFSFITKTFIEVGVYPFAKVKSVYSTTPADRTSFIIIW